MTALAENPAGYEGLRKMTVAEQVANRRWHHRFEITPGVTTPGRYEPMGLFKRLRLPEDLSGKRVLDVGARDGFFTMKCEQAGAEVVAVDTVVETRSGFSIVRDVHGLKAQYLRDTLYNLTPERLGKFDIVLYLGVIYHLPDPIGSLEVMRNLVRDDGRVYVESTCVDDEVLLTSGTVDTSPLVDLPVMVYARRNSSSFWDLNSPCLQALLADAGFRTVRFERWGRRMMAEVVPLPT